MGGKERFFLAMRSEETVYRSETVNRADRGGLTVYGECVTYSPSRDDAIASAVVATTILVDDGCCIDELGCQHGLGGRRGEEGGEDGNEGVHLIENDLRGEEGQRRVVCVD